jgi:hypothetical protein
MWVVVMANFSSVVVVVGEKPTPVARQHGGRQRPAGEQCARTKPPMYRGAPPRKNSYQQGDNDRRF